MEQLELPLWEMLKEATTAPDEADLYQLLHGLEQTLSHLDTVTQLQVAGEAIGQIVQVFQERSALAFEELEATNSDEGPTMPEDAFDRYVRQTMEVNFEPFIEPLVRLSRKPLERQNLPEQHNSIVGELDSNLLLQALDEQMSQHPGLTEAEAFNQAMAIAHAEDVSSWTGAIAQWMGDHQVTAIPLLQLHRSLPMPLIQLWLALLLGGYRLEQRGSFYDTDQVWVSRG